MASQGQRQHLRYLMEWTLLHTADIHYAQVRPMKTIHLYEHDLQSIFANGGGITMDCSEGVTLLCKLAGLRDPNGRGYDGFGFTGTLLSYLPHYYDPKHANVGALVVYGSGSGHHVSMVLEPGHDPLLWSHGRESAPERRRLSDQKKSLGGPVTFLNISKL